MENLILNYRGLVHNEILEYEGIPFRCHRCHQVGNVYKYFLILVKENQGITNDRNGNILVEGSVSTEEHPLRNLAQAHLVPQASDNTVKGMIS